MTHDGRMTRGKANYEAGLLDNEDTKYFMENSNLDPKPVQEEEIKEEVEEEKEEELEEKKTKSKRKK